MTHFDLGIAHLSYVQSDYWHLVLACKRLCFPKARREHIGRVQTAQGQRAGRFLTGF
jgi:hypothetical protein